MKSNDAVGVTFVNSVVGRGILNNVVNLSFSTFNFTPTDEVVDPDPVISCRLRMDKTCAYQLRQVLDDLIKLIEEKEDPSEIESTAKTEGVVTEKAPRVKPH